MDDLTVFRHRKHLTRRALAARVGVSPHTIRLWENGTMQPRALHIPQLAVALGVGAEQLTNVSTDLTALADARARVRIDAAERDPNTVGSVLSRCRTWAGLTEQELATWLGIDLPVLADLAEEIRPEQRQPFDGQPEMGLDQLAEMYGAHRARLYEAFDQGDP